MISFFPNFFILARRKSSSAFSGARMWCFFVVGSLRGAAVGSEWSLRRSGIEGALPFRGGAGDFLKIRLAGTPAGRFAALR